MEIPRINFENKMLVHLQLEKSKTYAYSYCHDSELICRKIKTLVPETPSAFQSSYPITIIDRVFDNSHSEDLNLDNLKGIISPVGHELLVTICFDGHLYEVSCKAIIADTLNRKFTMVNFAGIGHDIFPRTKIDKIKKLGFVGEKIHQAYTSQREIDFDSEFIKLIVSMVCNAVNGNTGIPIYTKDSKDNLYYTTHIHSIEVLQKDSENSNYINNYLEPADYEVSKLSFWHSGTWTSSFSDIYVVYNFEDKLILISSTYEETVLKRDNDFKSYYEEEIEYHYLKSIKRFNSRYAMKNFILNFEEILIKNNLVDKNQDYDIHKSDFSFKLKCNNIDVILNNMFKFVEYSPSNTGLHLTPDIINNYTQYISWFEDNYI